MTGATDPRLLLLSPGDTVYVLRGQIAAGEILVLSGQRMRRSGRPSASATRSPVLPAPAGDKVMKYGAPIGSATQAIALGDHVHLHNLKSDYTPTIRSKRPAPRSRPPGRPEIMMRGYPRSDGRKGIRNVVAVAYLVECAHHVAREIAGANRDAAHVIGFPGCFPEPLCAEDDGTALHPPQCGCGAAGQPRLRKLQPLSAGNRSWPTAAGRSGPSPSRTTAARAPPSRAGRVWVGDQAAALAAAPTVPMAVSELVVGTVCGGSDGTSGITGNPAAGSPSTGWWPPAPPASSRKPAS